MEEYKKDIFKKRGTFWLGANAKDDEFTRILNIPSHRIDGFMIGDVNYLGYKIEYYDLFMKNFDRTQSYFVKKRYRVMT